MPAGIFPRLDTIILRVRDLEAAQEWYGEKLGLAPQFVDPNEQIVVLDCGGPTSLTLYLLQTGEVPAPAGAAGTFPLFYSEDAAAHRQHLVAVGVECGELIADNGAVFFPFYDLDGNRLEVCQY